MSSPGTSSEAALLGRVEALGPQMVAWRRDLHRHAETGWTEFRTSALVAGVLRGLGYEVALGRAVVAEAARMGLPSPEVLAQAYGRALDEGAAPELLREMEGGFTGVVGRLVGGQPGPTLGLRFDIDALDVQEAGEADHLPVREGFVSGHPGAMHACGHDGHTAIGLAVAHAVAEVRAAWPGRVVLVFQPAEEGVRGARAMAEAGVVDDCDVLLCCHLGAQSGETGRIIGGISGFLATAKLDATFTGRESHAGLEPEAGRNALLGAATAVLNLQALPRHSGGESRVNVGVLHAGSGRNVTPGRAEMKLEVRGATQAVTDDLEARARAILEASAAMHGLELSLALAGASPTTQSDPAVVARVGEVAQRMAGVTGFQPTAQALASDDAAALMRRVQERGGQAAYVIIGAALASGHHTPRFDFDEAALPIGARVMAASALALASAPPERAAARG